MATKMKRIRKERGLTVRYLARKLNISPSYYYKIEQKKCIPNIQLAGMIADILESSIEEIFFTEDS